MAHAFFGGRAGIRTPDLYSAIVALSQLSYTPAQLSSIVAPPRGTVKGVSPPPTIKVVKY
jgi:hypothetical protein